MSNRSLILGVALAMSVAGLAWAWRASHASLVTGRVSSVQASDRGPSIGTDEGSRTFRLEASSPPPRFGTPATRRLLGGLGLATLAVALLFRARRPVTL